MEPNCEACNLQYQATGGVVNLDPANESAFHLAQSIRALGSDLAIDLRGGLIFRNSDEAFAMGEKLTIILTYLQNIDRAQEFEMMSIGLGGGRKSGGGAA